MVVIDVVRFRFEMLLCMGMRSCVLVWASSEFESL